MGKFNPLIKGLSEYLQHNFMSTLNYLREYQRLQRWKPNILTQPVL